MGKVEQEQQLPVRQRQDQRARNRGASAILCQRCSMGLCGIGRIFSLKCILFFILGVAVFLSAGFWVLPFHSRKYGFDAKEDIKRAATVQAYFRLNRPVLMLVRHVARLEYDIYEEIGVPSTKVAILSMHQAGESNCTNVVFGVLPDHMNVAISTISLSVLRSSLIELFLPWFNLTLSTIFGEPYSFGILKFPGGLTVIPEQAASIWQLHQILFNFTLHNSVYEIKENIVELKEQLKMGLHMRPYENVFVQLTNNNGSTRDPPVTIQASVMSNFRSLLPERLKQLAQTITGSPPAKNLGLDNSVFGEVKEISLSSFLRHTLHATPPMSSPTPSPAPSADKNDCAGLLIAPVPAFSPSYSPVASPDFNHIPPCFNCDAPSPSYNDHPYAQTPNNGPELSLPPVSYSSSPFLSPSPSSSPSSVGSRHLPNPHFDPKASTTPSQTSHPPSPALSPVAPTLIPTCPTARLSPTFSPLPTVPYGSNHGQDKESGKGCPSLSPASILSLTSSSARGLSYKEILWFHFFGLLTFLHSCFLCH